MHQSQIACLFITYKFPEANHISIPILNQCASRKWNDRDTIPFSGAPINDEDDTMIIIRSCYASQDLFHIDILLPALLVETSPQYDILERNRFVL